MMKTAVLVLALALAGGLSARCAESGAQALSPSGPSTLAGRTAAGMSHTFGANDEDSDADSDFDDEDSDFDDEDSDVGSDVDSDEDSDRAEHDILHLQGVVLSAPVGCAPGSFTVRIGTRDVIVRTTSLTRFLDGTCDDLRTLGRRIDIRGRVALDRSIDAVRIEFDD